MAKVQVYTTTYCPFCTRAKALLKNKGVAFEEIDVTNDDQLRQKMVELAGGRRTVPEIFINDKIVGGYDELRALETELRVISSHLIAGQHEIRVYADSSPGDGFRLVDAGLEDVYFLNLANPAVPQPVH